jgi:GT2 family glycosyltransferase
LHIEDCVRSILSQGYPFGKLEVLVVDGMSDDGTREILSRLATETSGLSVVDNPLRTTPAALNRGIQASHGQYIAILGAHAEYAADYLQACCELLQEHPEICCAGGPIVSRGHTPFGQAVAQAMSHPIGIGNAKHRLPNYEGYAEGACFPVFRREVFDKVGLFDERFVFAEDDELNYRLARAGEKIFISPRARCTYFVRETPYRLFQQYVRYGMARVAVLRKYRLPAAFRQVVPPLFIGLMLGCLCLALWLPGPWKWVAAMLPLLYLAVLLTVAAGIIPSRGWRVAALFPMATATMHTAYAVGFARAFLKPNHQTNATQGKSCPVVTTRPEC